MKRMAVRMYWLRHLEKHGLIHRGKGVETRSNRYGLNLHEFRDNFRSLWQKSGAASEAAEFMMGHVVDPLGYNKAFRDEKWLIGEYRKASKWLNIFSSDRPFGLVDEESVDVLKAQVESLQAQVAKMEPAYQYFQTLVNRRAKAKADASAA